MSMDEAARGVGVAAAFQPIVALDNERVVGFEALARWPELPGIGPQEVFDHSRSIGTSEHLDARCIEVAAERALHSAWPEDTVLSLNWEPASRPRAIASGHPLLRAKERFSVMFEITERGLLDHPRALLETVEALRGQGFLIALDDVGASPDSSALLDIIAPDVIKLDLTLVQSQPDYRQAQTLSSVIAHHERTGAMILAEGIETEAHLEQALALGADLGQGYLFGRPGEDNHRASAESWNLERPTPRPETATTSPFSLIKDHHRVRTARKATVIALSQHIEIQASRAADPPIILTALQRSEFLTPGTFRRYVDLAGQSPLVAIFGLQIPPGLDADIRGVPLAPDDPLCDEWTVVALGPHTAAALIARESRQAHEDTDGDRRFDFVITYDRTLVTEAARSLLSRVE